MLKMLIINLFKIFFEKLGLNIVHIGVIINGEKIVEPFNEELLSSFC